MGATSTMRTIRSSDFKGIHLIHVFSSSSFPLRLGIYICSYLRRLLQILTSTDNDLTLNGTRLENRNEYLGQRGGLTELKFC